MNITLGRSDLISALQIVSKGLSTKPQTPILSGVYMTAKEGLLELQSTNYELGFIVTIPAEIHTVGTAVLPGKYLTEFTRKLPAEEISIDTESSDGLAVIKSGTARFTLRTMEVSDFPVLQRMDGTLHFTIKDRTLARLVKKSTFACLREEQRDRRPIFTGCQLEVEGQEVTFAATNVHRLAVKSETLDADAGQIRVIIPARFLEEVTRTITGEVPSDINVTCSYNQVSMSSGSIYMTSRLIEGAFPDYRRVIPRDENIKTRVTLDAHVFASAVERASLIARTDQYNIVKLAFEKGLMRISSNSPEIGETEETIPAEVTGDDVTIAFNASYLMDAMKSLDSDTCILSLQGANEQGMNLSPMTIHEEADPKYIYVVTPVRTH
ncbi:DNA polymerase III, beta subunit [Selenomonas sp. oral taxon 892 str. F0426]|uniref:DNA polymerase III subunit beta n=1 Tax=Selenomonas sp. oral taxon 892 TaxID=1321785 RepID=UPI0003AD7644|nr:DNA polymerase III subunit beta [Selenomonas sp. oral taxon 892]ERJ92184.1 DNA polymerase III, beta subunit [Selenomonas sp. oral taxon 892 str. F0426]